jgi:flagellar biosynthesis/type III secretory pathway M-ring protein FliF/YscJ
VFLLNRRRNIFVLLLIALSAIGLLYTLFFEPGQLVKQLAIYAFFGVVIFLIYKWFIKRRIGGKEHSAYLKAAKQSARRFNEQGNKKSTVLGSINKKATLTSIKKPIQPSTQKKKTTHLTVIEGKKGKKKNRAFF